MPARQNGTFRGARPAISAPLHRASRGPGVLLVLGAALCALPACAVHHGQDSARAQMEAARAQFMELRDNITDRRLSRSRTPGPSLAQAQASGARDGVSVVVRVVSAEAQTWNDWPDGTTRIFNDGAGYLLEVQVRSAAPVVWNAARTSLAVNTTEQVFAPAESADEVLMPLVEGANLEARLGLPGDYALRVRSAGPFRASYLSTSQLSSEQTGFLLFPAPAEGIHAIAMELTLGLDVGAGSDAPHTEDFVFLFE